VIGQFSSKWPGLSGRIVIYSTFKRWENLCLEWFTQLTLRRTIGGGDGCHSHKVFLAFFHCKRHRWKQKEKNERIPFTLTYKPHNLAAKNIILKNFKLLQNDNETGRIFSQPPLISFIRDKNIGNFLVRSILKSDGQPLVLLNARKRCNTCTLIHNADKITGPKRLIKLTDRVTCTSANVIYCITCTLCKKIYIGEAERRLGDRFREHLRDVERNDKDASKPVAWYFNLPNHSSQHMTICGLSVHQGNMESRKNLEQKFIF